MQQLHTVSAIGYYPRPVEKPPKTQPELRTKWREDDYTATLPTAFAIYTSIDGTKYEKKQTVFFALLAVKPSLHLKTHKQDMLDLTFSPQ